MHCIIINILNKYESLRKQISRTIVLAITEIIPFRVLKRPYGRYSQKCWIKRAMWEVESDQSTSNRDGLFEESIISTGYCRVHSS